MTIHIEFLVWALHVLWGVKKIWFMDRLRLWRKTINLYLSFLAFTDKDRPDKQLRLTMACAILSAVYDYDTDWINGRRSGENFFKLLKQLVRSKQARKIAAELFIIDTKKKLSKDGLERGGTALLFYRLVIDSKWLGEYTEYEILKFGQKLQIIDDLLDLEGDRLAGDTNCFLLPDQEQKFVNEAEEFLKSDFFLRLKDNSRIYRTVENKARQKLLNFRTQRISIKQLFNTSRISTGVYAGILASVSFTFHETSSWLMCAFTAFSYLVLTMSIMTFNDWVDRKNDRKKGKTFASEHPVTLFKYWLFLNTVTIVSLGMVALQDLKLALYCLSVWVIGTLYSYTQRLYIFQNIIVAICSGSPALAGMVHHQETTSADILTFLVFTSLIFINEVYKDIEDRKVDIGYKNTLPVNIGHISTVAKLFGLCFMVAIPFVLHPNHWMGTIALIGFSILMYEQASMFLHPELAVRPKNAIRWMLKILLVVLILT
ncbi:MAG: UbiA prenyltransferase family protein [Patescibacteria group bacterium]